MNRRGFLTFLGFAPLAAPALAREAAASVAGLKSFGGMASWRRGIAAFGHSDPLGDFLATLAAQTPDLAAMPGVGLVATSEPSREVREFLDDWNGVGCRCSMQRLANLRGGALDQDLHSTGERAGLVADRSVKVELGDVAQGPELQIEQGAERGLAVMPGELDRQVREASLDHAKPGFERGDVSIVHFSAPSVGVATPMVSESELSSGDVGSGSDHILRAGRAS